jgi:hypothetical protein
LGIKNGNFYSFDDRKEIEIDLLMLKLLHKNISFRRIDVNIPIPVLEKIQTHVFPG